MHFYIRERDLHALKRDFGNAFHFIPHSHACEALAAALGLKTFAALKAGLAKSPFVAHLDRRTLIERLQGMGHCTKSDGASEERSAERALRLYRCTQLPDAIPSSSMSVLAALTGWEGSPITAFARDFDVAFDGDDAPGKGDPKGKGVVKEASIGFRGSHSPLLDCILYGEESGAIPGWTLEAHIRSGSIDFTHVMDAVLYLERFARDMRCSLAFMGVDPMPGMPLKVNGTALKERLADMGYVDVTGFWTSPRSKPGDGPAKAMLKSYRDERSEAA